ncbi:recombinase RecT [Polynucleobacter sp. IMCC30063]|uniref:recombinase RecT n=1 Tax=Polynucleobacter sp. IMCC30063 TaxID=2907298 RepID=UPI001F441AA7|nr:recombinase RecT [Polynucleobacter sp. IMCC30063]MCE7505646.1 recombinase RecT [Polynucleobacter sp. IMCC30063]
MKRKTANSPKELHTIVDLREDLLEPIAHEASQISQIRQIRGAAHNQPIDLIEQLIAKEVTQTASILGLEHEELKAWLDLNPLAPAKVILSLLRTASEHRLDPIKDEVSLTQYEDGSWQVFITVDGWSKLMNQHPAFCGIEFTESPESINNVPTWISCSIYRTDRAIPTTVREYLLEVQNDHAIWQKMPRRMLRHRVMQQCARIAFGIGMSEATPKTIQAIAQKSAPGQPLQAKTDLNGKGPSRATTLKAFLSKQDEVSCNYKNTS